MGKLAAFSGVSAFPVRVKCASLAWHTLNAAIHQPVATLITLVLVPVLYTIMIRDLRWIDWEADEE